MTQRVTESLSWRDKGNPGCRANFSPCTHIDSGGGGGGGGGGATRNTQSMHHVFFFFLGGGETVQRWKNCHTFFEIFERASFDLGTRGNLFPCTCSVNLPLEGGWPGVPGPTFSHINRASVGCECCMQRTGCIVRGPWVHGIGHVHVL